MVKLTTKISFDVKLDSERVQKTTKTVSRVLRVVKETIRTEGFLPLGESAIQWSPTGYPDAISSVLPVFCAGYPQNRPSGAVWLDIWQQKRAKRAKSRPDIHTEMRQMRFLWISGLETISSAVGTANFIKKPLAGCEI